MPFANHSKLTKAPAIALALTLGFSVAACGGMPSNQSLYSVKQPVVERNNYTFDVRSAQSGLSISEQQRVAAWFETMKLGYGDRVSIDDPMASKATQDAISALAARHGVIVDQGAPVTQGYVQPGNARIVLTRSSASVPGCPDWSESSDFSYKNGTPKGYGCATNSNLAAMVANPEDLIEGQSGTGETVIMSGTKAIDSFRERAPSGNGGDISGGGGGGGGGTGGN
jgi:pilus assembly protein CpaD